LASAAAVVIILFKHEFTFWISSLVAKLFHPLNRISPFLTEEQSSDVLNLGLKMDKRNLRNYQKA